MDALGQPLENLAWDSELRERTKQLIADQRAMAPDGDFDAQMRKIRDVRFEFTRMEVEVKYLGMHVVQDFMKALGLGPDDLLKKLRQFNDWVTKNLPEISAKIVKYFMPIWNDVKEVFASTAIAMKDTADAFSNVVGLLTGDNAITKSTDTFEKFGLAIQKVSHIFAVFAETLANVEDLLSLIISALVHVAHLDFSSAWEDVKAMRKDVNARTIGAAAMVGTALVAPELLPEEAETIEGLGGATLTGEDMIAARALAREALPWYKRIPMNTYNSLISTARKHWLITSGIGANYGDSMAGGGASPALISAMTGQESGGNNSAVSPKGARGLMQLMPPTAKELGVNPYDPAQNVAGGTAYINQLLRKYAGSEALALGAYNAGPGRMDAFLTGKATLPKETQDYIAQVYRREGRTGDVNVGGITIHITQPGASADHIARRVADETGKQVQRNMQEFTQQAWSY
jgi:soluble lytic murein transglycosylase-like protein